MKKPLSPKTYFAQSSTSSWEEILEASAYYERIAELLEHARQSVVFVGWQVDSRLRFQKPFPETLKEKLLRLCHEKPDFQVFFLVWDHALLYCLEREFWQRRIWGRLHPRIHFVFDNRHPFGGSHHEKIVLIDHRIALCGGVDLCDERWDSRHHFYFDQRRSLNWKEEQHGPYHDLSVQVTGPICQEIYAHLSGRWNQLSSTPLPRVTEPFNQHLSQDQVGHAVYLSRTLSKIDASPNEPLVIREIEHLFRSLIQRANHRILMEGQYYWSERINEFLISKMHQMKGKLFEIYLILCDLRKIKSLTRLMAFHQLGLLVKLHQAAQETQTKLNLFSPVAASDSSELNGKPFPPKPVYIHSKLILIDDSFISIGSANLANRAFRTDSELQLTFEARTIYEQTHIRNFFDRSLQHWNDKTSLALRQIDPVLELAELRQKNPLLSKVSWQLLFDSRFPLAFPLKRFFQSLRKRTFGPTVLRLFIFLIWILGAFLITYVSGPMQFWSLVYALLLSSVWLLPIPFIATSLLICFHLGQEIAPVLIAHAFMVSSLFGYIIARIFPNATREYIQTSVGQPLGDRSFLRLVTVLVNPSSSIHSKIYYPGLFFVPLSGYVPAYLLLFPATLYILFKGVGFLFTH